MKLKLLKKCSRILIIIMVTLSVLYYIEDETSNVIAADPVMTDKKSVWEGTNNVTQVLSFNATAENGEDMTWTLSTNLSCFSLDQNVNGTRAWINGTPSFLERDQWYWTHVKVAETLKPKKVDYNNFTTYINNTPPLLLNKIEDEIIIQEGTLIAHEYICVDINGDPTTCTVVGHEDLEIIEKSPTVLYGAPYGSGIHDVTVTVTDGIDVDTNSFTLRVLERDKAKGGGVKGFDFECDQINPYQIKCYVSNTKGIPIDRLKFRWDIESEKYYGNNITHQFNETFDWGENVTVSMTVFINTGLVGSGDIELGRVSKVIYGNMPLWIWIVIGFFILVLLYYLFLRRRG